MPLIGDADWTQSHYKFYNDDALQSQVAAIDTNVNAAINSKIRLRVQIDNLTGTNTYRYILEFKRNNGSWQPLDIGAESFLYQYPSSFVADATNTSQKLGSSTFTTGEILTTTRSSKSITLNSSSTELEWNILIPRNSLLVGDTVQFRVVGVTSTWNGGGTYTSTLLTVYSVTPMVTIVKENTMPGERATFLESLQFGVETTQGVAVAATKKPLGFELTLDPKTDIKPYRPSGSNKFNVDAARSKEISSLSAQSGLLSVNDLIYILASAMGAQSSLPVTTPNNNGTFLVTFSAGVTGGTFTLTYNGQTTANITVVPGTPATTIANITAAFGALSTVGAGTFIVKSITSLQYSITFYTPYSTSSNLITGTNVVLTGATPTITVSAVAATTARRWTFTPSPNSPDIFQTLTIEKGQQGVANYGMQAAFGAFSDLSLKFSPSEVSFNAKGFAAKMTDAFTMTVLGSGAEIPLGVVDPASVGFWYGTSLTSLVRATRNMNVDFNSSNRLKPVITLDESVPSISGIVEDSGWTLGLDATVEHDAAGQALYAAVSAKQKQFLVIEVTGSAIETGAVNATYNHRIKMIIPVQFTDPNKTSNDGLEVFVLKGTPVYNASFGSGISIIIDSAMSTY